VPVRGVLVTNFCLIKAGAIHRANGGYLLLDARSVLLEPFSWPALKRTLRRGEIVIEDIARFLGRTSTVSLQPDPIPLKVKVVLFADRLLYFLLSALDPEMIEHFKVLSDFENDFARTPENETMLARLVSTLARRDGLRPLHRDAVALVLEHAARLADHAGKLSLVLEQVRDILVEADYFAQRARRDAILRADVDDALRARIRRADRLRDRAQEAILEQVALIDTTGAHIGQVNGLSATGLGIDTACLPLAVDPADRRRGAEVENARCFAGALTRLDDLDRTHPEVLRVSLRHRLPPQLPLGASESEGFCEVAWDTGLARRRRWATSQKPD
jgi:predicted ATP-dependent protease